MVPPSRGSGRGKGWLPDEAETVREELVSLHFSKIAGVMGFTVPTSEINYTGLVPRIPDQGSTSSCVGQAFTISVWLVARVMGITLPWPSAKAIYDFARAEDSPYVKLLDAGSRPLAAIRCMVEMGLVAETDWPIMVNADGSTNINIRPPLDVYQQALGYRVGDYYRIPSGPGASALIDRALAAGKMPVFAMPVDEAYERWDTGAVYPGRKGTSLGGHMQCIAGNGDGHKKIVSSWGTTHGSSGIVKIASDYFDSGEVTDIIVATVVPRLAAA